MPLGTRVQTAKLYKKPIRTQISHSRMMKPYLTTITESQQQRIELLGTVIIVICTPIKRCLGGLSPRITHIGADFSDFGTYTAISAKHLTYKAVNIPLAHIKTKYRHV